MSSSRVLRFWQVRERRYGAGRWFPCGENIRAGGGEAHGC